MSAVQHGFSSALPGAARISQPGEHRSPSTGVEHEQAITRPCLGRHAGCRIPHSRGSLARNRSLADSKQDLIYAHSWYLDIVAPNWEALVEDDYVSIFPLTCRKKFGISYLFQPYFTQQLGLFSTGDEKSESKLGIFLNEIPEKFRLIEIQLNTGSSITHADGFKINKRKTHHLDLSSSHENIRKNYSENLIRNIKKAEKAGLKKNTVSYEKIIQSFLFIY